MFVSGFDDFHFTLNEMVEVGRVKTAWGKYREELSGGSKAGFPATLHGQRQPEGLVKRVPADSRACALECAVAV